MHSKSRQIRPSSSEQRVPQALCSSRLGNVHRGFGGRAVEAVCGLVIESQVLMELTCLVLPQRLASRIKHCRPQQPSRNMLALSTPRSRRHFAYRRQLKQRNLSVSDAGRPEKLQSTEIRARVPCLWGAKTPVCLGTGLLGWQIPTVQKSQGPGHPAKAKVAAIGPRPDSKESFITRPFPGVQWDTPCLLASRKGRIDPAPQISQGTLQLHCYEC